MVCDLKLSGDTFLRMMPSLENDIFKGCKLPPQNIFSKYDENNSGIFKNLEQLKSQIKLEISYEDKIQKNNGK
jgi:hypothetical protein